MYTALTYLNIAVVVLMTAVYFYQFVYTAYGLLYGRRRRGGERETQLHRFAALICARDEAGVISQLIDSLKAQDYPAQLLDIYVLADNCSDDTAKVARAAGATVYERFDKTRVGKGYALDCLLKHIGNKRGEHYYDAYFVFDADNVVDSGFVRAMNLTFSGGYDVITCYRNSKNFAENWITYGYSVWFLREARFLNCPRMHFGNNCAVSGTGFLVSQRVVSANGGWPFYLLTEDIQFSVDCAVEGRRIGYCDGAIVYDEQPTSFAQSWRQRLRWAKGFYQVDARYILPLLRGVGGEKERRMSCYDMLMTIAPGMLLSIFMVLFNLFVVIACLSQPYYTVYLILKEALRFLSLACINSYFGLCAYGLLTVLSEWGRIREKGGRKLLYLWAFPIFMATYIPIAVVALISRVEWKPIRHFASDPAKLSEIKKA